MGMTELFPNSYVARFRGNKPGQFGFFYSKGLNILMVGRITEDHCLSGEVVHDGILKDDMRMACFRRGYKYGNWDQHDFEYLGHASTYNTLEGYLKFIKDATEDQLKAYFKAKPLVMEYFNTSLKFIIN